MQQKSKLQLRKQKIANIKTSLKDMPILQETTHQLEMKIQRRYIRKTSAQYSENQSTFNRLNSESDYSSQKYPSLFKDKYDIGEKIGEGAHGIVKKCYSKDNKQLYAVKILHLDREHILFLKNNFMDIRQLRHPHIIDYKMLFFEMKAEVCYLVMDYLPYPNLLHVDIHSEELLKRIIYQLLQALKYIHSHKICHRDIKPENILYDQQHGNVTLIDFGISKKCVERGRKRDMLTVTGTPFYRAPEMFEGGGYDQKVDMWALGITMYQLMTGKTPFQSQYSGETINNIRKGDFNFTAEAEDKYSKSARNLVARLLKNRKERLTAVQAMKDMWFIKLHKGEEEFTKSLTVNQSYNSPFNSTHIFNSSHVGHNSKTKSEYEEKDQLKSLKELPLSAQQVMIYGCDSPYKKTVSLKQILTRQI